MKRKLFLISLVGMIGLLIGCSSSLEETSIQPTEGKLTFAFFYTDG